MAPFCHPHDFPPFDPLPDLRNQEGPQVSFGNYSLPFSFDPLRELPQSIECKAKDFWLIFIVAWQRHLSTPTLML